MAVATALVPHGGFEFLPSVGTWLHQVPIAQGKGKQGDAKVALIDRSTIVDRSKVDALCSLELSGREEACLLASAPGLMNLVAFPELEKPQAVPEPFFLKPSVGTWLTRPQGPVPYIAAPTPSAPAAAPAPVPAPPPEPRVPPPAAPSPALAPPELPTTPVAKPPAAPNQVEPKLTEPPNQVEPKLTEPQDLSAKKVATPRTTATLPAAEVAAERPSPVLPCKTPPPVALPPAPPASTLPAPTTTGLKTQPGAPPSQAKAGAPTRGPPLTTLNHAAAGGGLGGLGDGSEAILMGTGGQKFKVAVPQPYPGVQFRKSKNMDDRWSRFAQNGSIVEGHIEDEVWVRLGPNVLLPMQVGDIKVLQPLPEDGAACPVSLDPKQIPLAADGLPGRPASTQGSRMEASKASWLSSCCNICQPNPELEVQIPDSARKQGAYRRQ